MDAGSTVGGQLAAVGSLEASLEDGRDALAEAGEAPVDVPVEDAHRHPGPLAAAEEGDVEQRVGRKMARLGERVGDRGVLPVDEVGHITRLNGGQHPAHGLAALGCVAGDVQDAVAQVDECPAHGQGTQHRGGHAIRL